MPIEAEDKKDEACAKLLKAQANPDMHLIAQIEKLTAMVEIADKNQDETAAKLGKLNEQLLD